MSVMNRMAARVGNFPVEIPAAVLAAGAVAFLTLIAPEWRLERLVGATGLGQVLPSARPPLGDNARMLLALVSGALALVLVWTGLRALEPRDRLPEGFPAFRREDLHPDAPRRRPILAGEEFGTPDVLELTEPMPEQVAEVAAAPLPSFLQVPQEVDSLSDDAGAVRPAPQEPDFAALASAIELAPVPAAVPEQTVPELMARLERGLAARGPAPVTPVANEDTQTALRAIAAELKLVASAG